MTALALFGLDWLAPEGLWALALLAPLVVLYILKIQRKRRTVSSTFLWAAAERDMLARSPFRKLIAQIPLLIQALALILFALSLARPASRGRDLLGEHVAIVLDTSASMSATDSPEGEAPASRMARAKEAARAIVGGLPPGSDVLVLEAGRDARIASPLDRDKGRVLSALDAIEARDLEGDLGPAIALAADRLRPLGGASRIVVITDGALARRDPLPSTVIPLEVVTVGAPIDNAAIVRVDVRSGTSEGDREQVQGFLVIANHGKSPRELYVTMREDNASDVLASRRVLVAPGERLPVVLSFHPTPGDYRRGLLFDIAPHDAMAADDVAYARVPAGQKLPTVLVTDRPNEGSSPWIERALRSDPGVDLSVASALDPKAIDPDSFIVAVGACPADPPGGDLLVVDPPEGPCFGTKVGGPVDRPQITSWDEGDPRLRFLTLDGVHIAKARRLTVDGPTLALVRAQEGPVVTDISTAARTATLVGFDIAESDWPLKASFVLFMRNVVEEARTHRAHGLTGPARVGEPMRVSLPSSATSATVTPPRGEAFELPVRSGLVVVPNVEDAGFYRFAWEGPQAGAIVVPASLASDAESDLSQPPLTAEQAAGATVRALGQLPEGHREWAWVLALIGLFVIVADVAFLTRPTRARAPSSRTLRPLLIAALVLAAIPLVYAGLTWVSLVSSTYARLSRPWIAIVLFGACAFSVYRLASWGDRKSALRVRLTDALASIALLAAGLAAIGVEVGKPLDKLTVVIAIDRSRSIDLVGGAETRVASELSIAEVGMEDDDRIATIAFAAEASIEDPLRPRSKIPAPQRAVVGRDATDLSAAIRRGLAEVPTDSAARIVLISDGVATRGDALSAAAAAVAAEIPIDVVVLEQRAVPDVRVVALRAPTRADEGEALDLRLVTSSPSPADIQVRVLRDGELIREATAKIAAGEDVLRIRELAPGPGLHRYEVAITAVDPALDEAAEDNSASLFVRVRGPAAALVLDTDAAQTAFVAKALEDGAFRVDTGGVGAFPTDLGGLSGYDLIVLSDIRAMDLSTAQIEALASYVRDLGGGLFLLGGDRSMGPGGYSRTPLEEVSPVSFDLKQEKRRASLAEVIGIDISGSMGMEVSGRTKLELANEAAARSAALLGAGDRLGVAHVDTVVKWSVPLGPLTDAPAVERAIRKVGPGGGGIYVDITLDAAYRALATEAVNLKHVLLFADGSDAEQMAGCRAKVTSAMASGITTSVIALGMGPDVPELEMLSKLGGGRFYLIDDATRLPSVFAQETILAARSSIIEEPFTPTLGAGSSATSGIAFDEAPPLGGYVVTIAKSRATVLLRAPDDDPLLAVWSAGVGRAAAFTSDLKDRWGSAWTTWPGAARMVAQVARDVSRKADDPHVRLEASATGGELSIRATVVGDDGRAESFRRLRAHIAGPGGFARDAPLEAIGAGAYAATIPLSRPGTYVAAARDELSGETVGTTGAALAAGEELRPTGSDAAALTRIAQVSGGKRRDTLAGVFQDRVSARFSYRDVTPWLLLFASFGLFGAVASRRLAVPEGAERWAKGLREARRQRRESALAARKAAPPVAAMSLLQAKRARGDRAPEPEPEPLKRAQPAAKAPPPIARGAPPKRPVGPGASADSPPSSQRRPLTAAEILLARRKGKR